MDTPDDQEQLYKIQLLQAFNLEQWNDTNVNNMVRELYDLLQADTQLQMLLLKVANIEELQFFINMASAGTGTGTGTGAGTGADADTDAGAGTGTCTGAGTGTVTAADQLDRNIILFTLLFQYDYFYLFHTCITDFIQNGQMRPETVEALLCNL